MAPEFAGKTALVTGASQGIGLAIAQTLSAQGCRVALNGRNVDRLNAAVVALPGAIAVAGDVSDPAQAKKVVNDALATLGRLDVLVCNVGSGRSVAPGMESFDEWIRVFAVNLWSATNSVEAARHALAQSKGVVVCISSICGLEVVPGAPVTYSAAKAALHAYVRGMARPLGSEGVRINAVAPGNILFDSSVWARRLADDPQAVQTMLARDVPLRRLGTSEEVADLVAFLASSRAAFATGGVWKLDGGQTHD
ncbi:SDR family NAD(P)-dependent oxidoreductase [Rhodoferax saidenbachensis]|uniref:Oxidoreductase n=1 Tax=Rhodoferax saidenbachensis TaxID=1484693 RepID=A0A1P8KDR3_9BURK|nr:SDR family NAD(P)-dependent oxidoreductase [Rhodoferax saidenbachensis]APW44187.1 oxidoreductase [Rhodoferax saidenbachensis]